MHIAHNFPCFINQLLRSLDCRGQSSVDGARSSCCWRFRWRTWHHGWWQSFHGIRGLRCRSCAVRSNLPSIHPSIHPSMHPSIDCLARWPSIHPRLWGTPRPRGRSGGRHGWSAKSVGSLCRRGGDEGAETTPQRERSDESEDPYSPAGGTSSWVAMDIVIRS